MRLVEDELRPQRSDGKTKSDKEKKKSRNGTTHRATALSSGFGVTQFPALDRRKQFATVSLPKLLVQEFAGYHLLSSQFIVVTDHGRDPNNVENDRNGEIEDVWTE